MSRATVSTADAARTAANAIADRLAAPASSPEARGGHPQCLATGAAGIALLHIERAHTAAGDPGTAHAWLRAGTRDSIDASAYAGLYRGAPAVAFALHTAADVAGPGAYRRATATLHRGVVAAVHRRVDQANARITAGELPTLAEFDIISGLSGIGAHLLRHAPGDDALARILTYLVRLTEPLNHDGQTLPGWWTDHDPHFTRSAQFPAGHGNLGLAHGISGPLALLALAQRRGITVDRHTEAIHRICAWLDTCRQDHEAGPWWPQWVTRPGRPARRTNQSRPGRPSWCYGTPGIARAQQLAGIATGDLARQQLAENALARCLADPDQLGRVIDNSICHGWAGLYQTAWRAANDATTPALAARLPHLSRRLLAHTNPDSGGGNGFLEGDAGTALALHTVADGTAPASGWDACLLIT